MAYPSQIFFPTLRDIEWKKVFLWRPQHLPLLSPNHFSFHPQPSFPPPPTLLPWVSPSFQSQPRPRIILNPSPPPLRPCMKGRMEKGGSIQQANQAFCLCLCRGGVGWGEVVRGLSTLALKQQQLVQRKKRAREGGKNTGRWGRRRGNGGKGNERERIIRV